MNSLALTVVKKSQVDNKELTKFQSYLIYFFVFSFTGWLLETIYSYFVLGYFANRGFFYGPICPIYGCGGLIMMIFLNNYKKNPLILFFYSVLIFSIFEYAIGYGVDALYNISLWNYNTESFNINGRICLFYSFAWGCVALAFTYIILPLFKKFLSFLSTKIPVYLQLLGLRFLLVLFIFDILYTFIEYSNI